MRHLTIIKKGLALTAAFGLCFAAIAQCHPGGLDKNGCHVESKSEKRHCHKKVFDPTKPAHAGDEGAFYGPLVRVKDGDTLVVKVQGVEVDFRLSGIDAPEIDQPFGPQARDELAAIIGTQQCVIVPVDHEVTYGRFVAYLWIGGLNVNEELMSRGMGWFDSRYAIEPFLYQLETEARKEQRGLWALPLEKRVPPWEWRKEQR